MTCTSASLSVTTSTPMRTRLFWIQPTARSLPGMVRDEKMAMSPLSIEMSGCSFSATRAMAARGSPWLPVQMQTTFERLSSENCCWST